MRELSRSQIKESDLNVTDGAEDDRAGNFFSKLKETNFDAYPDLHSQAAHTVEGYYQSNDRFIDLQSRESKQDMNDIDIEIASMGNESQGDYVNQMSLEVNRTSELKSQRRESEELSGVKTGTINHEREAIDSSAWLEKALKTPKLSPENQNELEDKVDQELFMRVAKASKLRLKNLHSDLKSIRTTTIPETVRTNSVSPKKLARQDTSLPTRPGRNNTRSPTKTKPSTSSSPSKP